MLARTRLVAPDFLDSDPFVVYAIASHHRLRAETEMAMKALKKQMPHTFPEERVRMCTSTLYRLTQYRAACVAAALQLVLDTKRWEENVCARCDMHFYEQMDATTYMHKAGVYGFGEFRWDCDDCCWGKYSDGIIPFPTLPVDLQKLQKELADTLSVTVRRRAEGARV